jgi:hypothetical protein
VLVTPASALSFGSHPEMEVTAAAGIDDIIKENSRVVLYLPPDSVGLNPTELVCGNKETELRPSI